MTKHPLCNGSEMSTRPTLQFPPKFKPCVHLGREKLPAATALLCMKNKNGLIVFI